MLGELAPEYHVFRKIGARFLNTWYSKALTPCSRSFLQSQCCEGLVAIVANRYLPTFRSAILSGAGPSISSPANPANPANPAQPVALVHAFNAEHYLAVRMAALDAALLGTERHLSGKDAVIFTDGKLRFPKEPRGDNEQEQTRTVTARLYAMMPRVRMTDLLDQVNHWTDFTEHFSHVSTGLPPVDQRAFMAALIAEATNLGLSRMAEMCGTVPRRALPRRQTWTYARTPTAPRWRV